MKNSYYILNQLLNNLNNLDGIVAYSVFQMPYDNLKKKIFDKILKKKRLFFACENLKISNKKDIDRIENIWV